MTQGCKNWSYRSPKNVLQEEMNREIEEGMDGSPAGFDPRIWPQVAHALTQSPNRSATTTSSNSVWMEVVAIQANPDWLRNFLEALLRSAYSMEARTPPPLLPEFVPMAKTLCLFRGGWKTKGKIKQFNQEKPAHTNESFVSWSDAPISVNNKNMIENFFIKRNLKIQL